MADEGASSTLVLIAAVLQLIIFFVLTAFTALFVFVLIVLPSIPPGYLPPGIPPSGELLLIMLPATIQFCVMTILSLFFSIAWFSWRKVPSQHKVGLIITGILGLLGTGVIPGILALIGGAIVSTESPLEPAPMPASPLKSDQPPTKDVVRYCSACGSAIANPNAQFCGVCGTSLI